jgi:hypothetical protein
LLADPPGAVVLVDHRTGLERVPARLLVAGDRVYLHDVAWTVEGVGPGWLPGRLEVFPLGGSVRQLGEGEPVWRDLEG